MRDDERAASTALGYVLTLGISAVLITGLIVGGGSYLEGERARITTEELRVHGERLAGAVGDADRLASAAAPGGRAGVRIGLPDRVAGSRYAVAVVDRGTTAGGRHRSALVLRADDAGVSVRIPIVTEVDLAAAGSLPGGEFRVDWDGSGPLRITAGEGRR